LEFTMSVVLSNLSFSFPDGRAVLSGVNASFGPGRTGLIGVNGSGKSTMLRLIGGRLRPSSGTAAVSGEVGYLPQDLTLDVDATVAGLLGIAPVRAALRAVEDGSVDQAVFDAVGDGWDIEDRAREWLDRLGLAHVGLDDPVRQLSGGETVLTALTALFLRRPAVLLLDEPTNNLDLDARRRLYAAVEAWPGVMLIVSHDRALLALVDQVAELAGGSLHRYGGNLEAYEAQRATDQAAAQRMVTAAAADVRRERRDLVESQVKQARRDRMGRALAASGSISKMAAGGRQRAAQVSAGKSRDVALARVADARARLAGAEEGVRDDPVIRISLPGTALPAGQTALAVRGLDGAWAPWHSPRDGASADNPGLAELVVRGPERIALTGPNGAGNPVPRR
jgi:ATPase subunit of ABC transporter with duplicated ATPase domains